MADLSNVSRKTFFSAGYNGSGWELNPPTRIKYVSRGGFIGQIETWFNKKVISPKMGYLLDGLISDIIS